ncbi:MAG: hypothetical protein ACI8TX_002139 [Hyphomicrobiaceae bacterium]
MKFENHPLGHKAYLVGVALLTVSATACIGGNLNAVIGEDGSVETTYGKVVICHKGETMEVTRSRLTNHMQHGDKRGKCR